MKVEFEKKTRQPKKKSTYPENMSASPSSDIVVNHPKDDRLFYTVDFGVNYGRVPTERVREIMNDAYNDRGVSYMVLISTNTRDWNPNENHVEHVDKTFMTLGCNGNYAKQFKVRQDIAEMQKRLDADDDHGETIIAIGECGLDYDRMISPNGIQCKVFRAQVRFAKKNGMPLYLSYRGRGAYEDIMWILSEEDPENEIPPGVVHCFTGDIDQALAWVKMGYMLGVTGWIYDKRRNTHMYKAVCDPRVPLENLLVETDAPHLGIHPRRFSEPVDTQSIAERLAYGRLTFGLTDKKEKDKVGNQKAKAKIGRILYENAYRFLRLSDDDDTNSTDDDTKEETTEKNE